MSRIEQIIKFLLRQNPEKLMASAHKSEKEKINHNSLIFHAISPIKALNVRNWAEQGKTLKIWWKVLKYWKNGKSIITRMNLFQLRTTQVYTRCLEDTVTTSFSLFGGHGPPLQVTFSSVSEWVSEWVSELVNSFSCFSHWPILTKFLW